MSEWNIDADQCKDSLNQAGGVHADYYIKAEDAPSAVC